VILVIRPASREEAVWLSSRLRPEDQREIETARGLPAEQVLQDAWARSREVYSIRFEEGGDPIALFGLADDTTRPGLGVPWFLATNAIARGRRAVLDYARMKLSAWSQRYPAGLHNLVDARNTLHLRWLVAAGCTLGQTVIVNKHPFVHFRKES
jgi:hypothetical protein